MRIKRVVVPWSCCRRIEIIYVKSLEVYCKCLRNETLAVININILELMTVSSYSIGSFVFNQGLTSSHPFVLQCVHVCCAQLLSHVRLFVTPWTVALQRFFQARILEWVAISLSRGSSWPKDQISISCISRDSLSLSHLERL